MPGSLNIMADWISIALLITIGLVLIYLELIFVPGTTVVGIIGLVLTGIGIYITFENYGPSTGYMVLGGSFVVSLIAIVYSFKSNSWDRFALKQQHKARFNQGYTDGLEVDQQGTAVSDLKPIGKVEFGSKTYEVTSHGDLIEAGREVIITRIENNKIIVDTIP